MNNQIKHEPDDRPEAVRHADAGARAWRAAAHAQQSATQDHSDFYELAGHLVDTLAAVESLARLLAGQVTRYADAQPEGQVVYDDSRTMDQGERLHDAALDLRHLAGAASDAGSDANRFWSAISHIGVEDAPTHSGPVDGRDAGPTEGEVSR